jgi:hypothetical protein
MKSLYIEIEYAIKVQEHIETKRERRSGPRRRRNTMW